MSKSDKKHAAIISAAKVAFKDQGVKASSMDKIAEMAGVSKRTVYNHFATKEALVLHILSTYSASAAIDAKLIYSSNTSLDKQLIALLETEINILGDQDYLDMIRVAFGHFYCHPDELKDAIEKFDRDETALHVWLKAAVDDQKLKPMDIDFAVTQLLNLVKGSCFWSQWLKINPVLNQQQKHFLAQESAAMFLSRYQI
ncbi:MAG: TetR/AcrR family transcriptional regulator [Gammaproteobacteria bacterium]|nr:TetR/AcrR family transcriptional regulator [Gammaproteobacteria bacterium]